MAHPKARLEAISSRPLLLAAVGKLTQHSGQKKLLLTMTHDATNHVKALVSNVQASLAMIRSTTPQFTSVARWRALIHHIIGKILGSTLEKANHVHCTTASRCGIRSD